ncbi:unnamed protein product [Anisakis simplex]|uniref:Uncharacterized protein n=1 Tax=Anisakis simplex TaxID=6269 RepID=A0A0M3KKB1_ANISI|nr:unnamed protein product [Anisakis simplex]
MSGEREECTLNKIIESAERRTYQLVSKELGAAGDMKQKQQQQQQPKALPPRSRSCLASSTYPVGYQPLTISSDSNRQRR